MGKSYKTHCFSEAMVIPAHETAPLFLYKPIKLATYSLCNIHLFLGLYLFPRRPRPALGDESAQGQIQSLPIWHTT